MLYTVSGVASPKRVGGGRESNRPAIGGGGGGGGRRPGGGGGGGGHGTLKNVSIFMVCETLFHAFLGTFYDNLKAPDMVYILCYR